MANNKRGGAPSPEHRKEMADLGYETVKVLAARHRVSVPTLYLWKRNGTLPVPPAPRPVTLTGQEGLSADQTTWKRWGNVWMLSEAVKLAVEASRKRKGSGRPIGKVNA